MGAWLCILWGHDSVFYGTWLCIVWGHDSVFYGGMTLYSLPPSVSYSYLITQSRYRPELAYRVDRGTALPFLDLSARRGWGVSVTPRPLYHRERPGALCRGGWVGPKAGLDVCEKSHPYWDLIPGPSSSLYRLSYRAHTSYLTLMNHFFECKTSKKICSENKNLYFVSKECFPTSMAFMIYCGKVWLRGTGHRWQYIARRMRIA
jgi:hypothetical protein